MFFFWGQQMGTKIAYACICHVGSIRKINQDNYLCEGMYRSNEEDTKIYPLTGEVSLKKCSVFGVFDGLGGEQCGEVSSYLAAKRAAQTEWDGNLKTMLYDFCIAANEEICNFAREEQLQSTGTTVAMLAFQGNWVYVCNLGDSRIFQITEQAIEQISKDHVAPCAHGQKPPLSQCLGIPKEEFVIEPYIIRFRYKVGERYLICSDGVTDMVSESELQALAVGNNTKAASQRILEQALDRGGRDNTTLILLEIKEDKPGIKMMLTPRKAFHNQCNASDGVEQTELNTDALGSEDHNAEDSEMSPGLHGRSNKGAVTQPPVPPRGSIRKRLWLVIAAIALLAGAVVLCVTLFGKKIDDNDDNHSPGSNVTNTPMLTDTLMPTDIPSLTVTATPTDTSTPTTTPTTTPTVTTIAIDETNFPDDAFRKYVSDHFDTMKDGQLSEDEIKAVTKIEIDESGKDITNLKGVEIFSLLESLCCNNCNLNDLDVRENVELTTLNCVNTGLTSLDVSKNTKLKELDCSGNKLEALDVNENVELTTLNCVNTGLTSLDVSKNTKLKELDCSGNKLEALDVSENVELTTLNCVNTGLTSLNVSKNTKLEELNCSENILEALEVSKNVELTTLSCVNTGLISLDVSKNTKLKKLDCSGNKLETLDVSKNFSLMDLWCFNNKLTALDVSKNTNLVEFYCYDNKLTTLDVSKNTALKKLYCHKNNLSALDLGRNIEISDIICDPGVDVTGAGSNVNIKYYNDP